METKWCDYSAGTRKFHIAELAKQGYSQVYTPHMGKLDLFRTSGHFPYYQDSQYPPIIHRECLTKLAEEGCTCSELSNKLDEGEIEGYLLKPMNCPMHIRIFRSEQRSYRDLPIRLAEFGTVYRWEQSGELNGMTESWLYSGRCSSLYQGRSITRGNSRMPRIGKISIFNPWHE